jgi:nucleoside-diphosphate-sugar epimerase
MKPNKVLIMGLGHLATFIVKEFGDETRLWGTYRVERRETTFNRVNKVRYIAGDDMPEALIQNWRMVIWNLPPFEGYKGILEEYHSRIDRKCPWIFVSSTSVFKNGNIHEDSKKESISKTGKLLIEIEFELKRFNRDVSIIRPGGLVDAIRSPANFFRARTDVKGAKTPFNLVHTHDVARFIYFMITKEVHSEDFNLVSDDHASKKDFYSRIMKANDVIPPTWDDNGSLHRIISNQKSKSVGFEYLYPDLQEYFMKQSLH